MIPRVTGSGQYEPLNRGTVMLERDHRIYYERRAAQSIVFGERATDPKIAALHYELALRYTYFSSQAEPGSPDVDAVHDEQKSASNSQYGLDQIP